MCLCSISRGDWRAGQQSQREDASWLQAAPFNGLVTRAEWKGKKTAASSRSSLCARIGMPFTTSLCQVLSLTPSCCLWISGSDISSLPLQTHISDSPGSTQAFDLRLVVHHWPLSYYGFKFPGQGTYWILWLSSTQPAPVDWPAPDPVSPTNYHAQLHENIYFLLALFFHRPLTNTGGILQINNLLAQGKWAQWLVLLSFTTGNSIYSLTEGLGKRRRKRSIPGCDKVLVVVLFLISISVSDDTDINKMS